MIAGILPLYCYVMLKSSSFPYFTILYAEMRVYTMHVTPHILLCFMRLWVLRYVPLVSKNKKLTLSHPYCSEKESQRSLAKSSPTSLSTSLQKVRTARSIPSQTSWIVDLFFLSLTNPFSSCLWWRLDCISNLDIQGWPLSSNMHPTCHLILQEWRQSPCMKS